MWHKHRYLWPFVGIGAVYLITRLWGLTLLPVFADEAIYIRWAQMMVNEPAKYLFIPLYDGKTPLYMWLLTLFLPLKPLDPLWSGRFLTVLVSLISLFILINLTKLWRGGRVAQVIVGLLYLFIPISFFHDRMALTDGLFSLGCALTVWSLVRLTEKPYLTRLLWFSMCFGIALLTKLPALFLIPILFLMPVSLVPTPKQSQLGQLYLWIGIGIIGGLLILYSLHWSIFWPFLFQRGADFTYQISELIKTGEWRHIFVNGQQLVNLVGWYFTLPLICLIGLAPVVNRHGQWRQRFQPVSLFLLGLIFCLPFLLLGKIVYNRYYLPLIVFWLPAAGLAFEQFWTRRLWRWLGIMLLTLIILQGGWFMWPWLTDVTKGRLPEKDTQQYLTEWSAGFGNREIKDYLNETIADQPVAVATEGYFGTLPDGLLMYFDRSVLVKKGLIEIFGVGEPITRINEETLEKAKTKMVYMVVNEHRLNFDYQNCCELVARYPRVDNGPALLLLRIKGTPYEK